MKNYKQIYAFQEPPTQKKKSSVSITNQNQAQNQQQQSLLQQHKKSNSINNYMYKNIKFNQSEVNAKHSKNFSQAINHHSGAQTSTNNNSSQNNNNSNNNSQNTNKIMENNSNYYQNRNEYTKSHKNSINNMDPSLMSRIIKRNQPYQSQPVSIHQSPKYGNKSNNINNAQNTLNLKKESRLMYQQNNIGNLTNNNNYNQYTDQQQENYHNNTTVSNHNNTHHNEDKKPISFLNYLLLKDINNQQNSQQSQMQTSNGVSNQNQNIQSSQIQQKNKNIKEQQQQSLTSHKKSPSINLQYAYGAGGPGQQNQNQFSQINQNSSQANNNIYNHRSLQSPKQKSGTLSNINTNQSSALTRQSNQTSQQTSNQVSEKSSPTNFQNNLISGAFRDQTFMKNVYQYHYVIGKGGFGKVWQVQHKKSKQMFALKEMSKALVITKKSVNSVLNERTLLQKLKHDFLVNMQYAFQDRDNLYLVMDLMTGGDLRYHIGRQRRFSEKQTQFFVCNIFLGLEYLHNNNIIHRDIKPENLVLDSKGFVRVTDLGIARVWKADNQNDTSGTPGYMAPEVMCRQPHTYAVDYFALGVLAYEFMLGRRPYLGRSRKEIRDQILAKRVQIKKSEIPPGWSLEAADFINRLIERKPANRLGINGPAEVKSHPWIKNFPWNQLINKTIQSPFIPGKTDNFDHKQQISVEDENNFELIQQNAILLKRPSVQGLFSSYNFDNTDNFLNSQSSNSNSQSSNYIKNTSSTQASSRAQQSQQISLQQSQIQNNNLNNNQISNYSQFLKNNSNLGSTQQINTKQQKIPQKFYSKQPSFQYQQQQQQQLQQQLQQNYEGDQMF